MSVRASALARDPSRRAGLSSRHEPIAAKRELQGHSRASFGDTKNMAEIHRKGLVFENAFCHFDASLAKTRETIARGARVGIAHGGDDTSRLGACDGVGASGATANMGARFERDVEGGTFG